MPYAIQSIGSLICKHVNHIQSHKWSLVPHFNSIKIGFHHSEEKNWMSKHWTLINIAFDSAIVVVVRFQYHIPVTIPNNNDHFENNDAVIGYLFNCSLPKPRRMSKWCQIVISFCRVHCIILLFIVYSYAVLSTIYNSRSSVFSKWKCSTATLNVCWVLSSVYIRK